MPYWSFLLTNAAGAGLAELTTATGRSLTFTRNGTPEAKLTISHDDEAAGLLFAGLADGVPLLRAYRDGVLRFHGYLAPFDEDLEEDGKINLVFRGPFGRLLGDGQDRGYFTAAAVSFVATDAGQIAKSLIDTANADAQTGISTAGSIPATKTRDRSYVYANVGEAIVDLTKVLDGFDFEVAPTEYTAGKIGTFNVYASQGQVKPLALFQYGPDTLRNVRHVQRQTMPPVNAARVLGAGGLTAVKLDAGSIAKYGKWWVQSSSPDVAEQATLDDIAQALLRPDPITVVRFTADPTLAPSPWDHFWLGDTVEFYARRGSFEAQDDARVHGITVTIDDEGNEATEIETEAASDSNDFQGKPTLPGIIADLSARVATTEVLASA